MARSRHSQAPTTQSTHTHTWVTVKGRYGVVPGCRMEGAGAWASARRCMSSSRPVMAGLEQTSRASSWFSHLHCKWITGLALRKNKRLRLIAVAGSPVWELLPFTEYRIVACGLMCTLDGPSELRCV